MNNISFSCSFFFLGSTVPPLHAAAAVKVDELVYIFGGQRLDIFCAADDFYSLNIKNKDITIVNTENTPSPRYGHTMDKIYDRYIMLYGGLTMDLRFSDHNVVDRFRQIGTNNLIYIFDIQTNKWSTIDLPALSPRSFHSTTVLNIGDISQVIILGGISKTVNSCERLPINEINIITFNDRCIDDVTFRKVIYNIQIPTYISSHKCTFFRDRLHIFGGLRVSSPDAKPDAGGSASYSSINIFDDQTSIVNYDINICAADYKTYGHSQLYLSDDTLLIMGGSIKSMYVYSTKFLPPASCDLGNECIINESEEIYTQISIPWIQCDLCHKWIHKFCAQVTKEPVVFHCNACSTYRSDARRATKTQSK